MHFHWKFSSHFKPLYGDHVFILGGEGGLSLRQRMEDHQNSATLYTNLVKNYGTYLLGPKPAHRLPIPAWHSTLCARTAQATFGQE